MAPLAQSGAGSFAPPPRQQSPLTPRSLKSTVSLPHSTLGDAEAHPRHAPGAPGAQEPAAHAPSDESGPVYHSSASPIAACLPYAAMVERARSRGLAASARPLPQGAAGISKSSADLAGQEGTPAGHSLLRSTEQAHTAAAKGGPRWLWASTHWGGACPREVAGLLGNGGQGGATPEGVSADGGPQRLKRTNSLPSAVRCRATVVDQFLEGIKYLYDGPKGRAVQKWGGAAEGLKDPRSKHAQPSAATWQTPQVQDPTSPGYPKSVSNTAESIRQLQRQEQLQQQQQQQGRGYGASQVLPSARGWVDPNELHMDLTKTARHRRHRNAAGAQQLPECKREQRVLRRQRLRGLQVDLEVGKGGYTASF